MGRSRQGDGGGLDTGAAGRNSGISAPNPAAAILIGTSAAGGGGGGHTLGTGSAGRKSGRLRRRDCLAHQRRLLRDERSLATRQHSQMEKR